MSATSSLLSIAKRPVKEVLKRRMLAGEFSPTVTIGARDPRRAQVFMCLYNRPDRIHRVLELLAGQSNVEGVDLHLWNNNRRDHAVYERAVRDFGSTGALRSVRLIRSPFNLGSIARFYPVRQLAASGYSGPIVVLDDDEEIRSDFLSRALEEYDAEAITAWWAFEVNDAYWDRSPSRPGGRVDHIGPGGMVCSAALFLDDDFFTELPQKYWLLDDLWLTYFAKSRGLALRKLDVEIDFVLPETNQHHLNPLKDEFFRYLYPEGETDTTR
ncbi:hypothetical protein [Antiquaquibacter soli]|uniref:Glycosyltransferase family 2 protein n=1 Tax=Antiquaquibacter soli TaxID=3064523 RepID=A0ABT9BJC5_9MICO|nr:hypothetical protein [Protaetiibacter sp. WY-16]MDO7881121.1 hypothetical protein [Protaetiibacter sp. WY-16]